MHAKVVLWAGKVSCSERCPQFSSMLIEWFHCILFLCLVCAFLSVIYVVAVILQCIKD